MQNGQVPRWRLEVEVAGYAGAAAAVVGTVVVLARADDIGDGGIVLVALVLTAVLVGAGGLIGGSNVDAYERLRSVLWFLGVLTWGLAVDRFVSGILELDPGGSSSSVLSSLLTIGAAASLWALHRRSLQVLALFSSSLGLVLLLIASAATSPDPAVVAVVLWSFGAAWVALGLWSLVRPRATAMVLGSLAALLGPYLVASSTSFPASFDAGRASATAAAIWSAATAVVLLVVASRAGVRAAQGVALGGILVASSVVVAADLSTSDGAALVGAIAGLVLLGVAAALARVGREPPAADPTPPTTSPPDPTPTTSRAGLPPPPS
jgi:hypothetical protein